MSSIWYSVLASVHELLEEFPIFYVKVHSDVHAQVRTGNLDIIPTSCVAVFMAARRLDGFFGLIGHFSRSSGLSRSSAPFLGPSMAKSSLPSRAPCTIHRTLLTYDIVPVNRTPSHVTFSRVSQHTFRCRT